MTYGVNYTAIAGSAVYVEWACFSAHTVKKHMPKVRTSLYTNRPDLVKKCRWGKFIDDILGAPDYDQIDWQGAKIDGVLASEELGYDVTLHTDADTVFCEDVTSVLDLMGTGNFDLALTLALDQRKRKYPLRGVHEGFSYYKNGTLVFPWNDAVRKFFADYRGLFNTHKVECASSRKAKVKMHPDMPAFNEALYHNSQLRLVFLPDNYNCQFWTGCLYQKVKIFHVHGMGGRKAQKTAKWLNENCEKPRLFRNREIIR